MILYYLDYSNNLKDCNNRKKDLAKYFGGLELSEDVEGDFSLVLGNLDLNLSESGVDQE